MELEESLLAYTKIGSSSEYKSKREASTGSALSLYTLLSPISLLLLPTPIDSSLFYYNNMS